MPVLQMFVTIQCKVDCLIFTVACHCLHCKTNGIPSTHYWGSSHRGNIVSLYTHCLVLVLIGKHVSHHSVFCICHVCTSRLFPYEFLVLILQTLLAQDPSLRFLFFILDNLTHIQNLQEFKQSFHFWIFQSNFNSKFSVIFLGSIETQIYHI